MFIVEADTHNILPSYQLAFRPLGTDIRNLRTVYFLSLYLNSRQVHTSEERGKNKISWRKSKQTIQKTDIENTIEASSRA